MRVGIIGAGYVGLTTGVSLAALDHEVTMVEKDPIRLSNLRNGVPHFFEPGLPELLESLEGKITFEDCIEKMIAGQDLIMIAVGTPPQPNGQADLSFVEQAAKEIANGIEPGKKLVVAVKSTVPLGTNRRVELVIEKSLKARQVAASVFIASNPEFLRESLALRDSLYPDRIVVGANKREAFEAMRQLYRPILEQTFDPPSHLPRPDGYQLPPYITTDPTSAEMIKYASNAFLAAKISFINEVAGLCERVGADVTEVARGMGLDNRIGTKFLSAGVGWGGSCFPKDTLALIAVAKEFGYTMPMVEASREVNLRQRKFVVDKLQNELKSLRGRIVAVLGLAFKPNTDDVRESPALDVIRHLVDLGAHVKAHDPIAIENARAALTHEDLEYFEAIEEAVQGTDAIVIATEWDEYHTLNFEHLASLMRERVIVDGRNILKRQDAEKCGFRVLGIGR
ncbi:MAG: UDP-glucose dehydrogenase family protein [Fimbriimonadaceae bacterium]